MPPPITARTRRHSAARAHAHPRAGSHTRRRGSRVVQVERIDRGFRGSRRRGGRREVAEQIVRPGRRLGRRRGRRGERVRARRRRPEEIRRRFCRSRRSREVGEDVTGRPGRRVAPAVPRGPGRGREGRRGARHGRVGSSRLGGHDDPRDERFGPGGGRVGVLEVVVVVKVGEIGLRRAVRVVGRRGGGRGGVVRTSRRGRGPRGGGERVDVSAADWSAATALLVATLAPQSLGADGGAGERGTAPLRTWSDDMPPYLFWFAIALSRAAAMAAGSLRSCGERGGIGRDGQRDLFNHHDGSRGDRENG